MNAILKCHYKAKKVKYLWELLIRALGFGLHGQEPGDFPQRTIIRRISFLSQTHLCLLTIKPLIQGLSVLRGCSGEVLNA